MFSKGCASRSTPASNAMKPDVSHSELTAPRKRHLENLDAGDEDYEGKAMLCKMQSNQATESELWETRVMKLWHGGRFF